MKLQLSKSKCRYSLALDERGPGNLCEQVEHVGVYMFARHLGLEWNTVETVGDVTAYSVLCITLY